MTFILSMLGFGRLAAKAIFDWLSRRSLAEVVVIIFAIAFVIMAIRCNHWRHVALDTRADLAKCGHEKQALQDTLSAISSRKNEQQIVTKTKIERVTKIVHDAEKDAHRLETAPSAPGNCTRQTPPAIEAWEHF